jgi:hypothetical protein
MKYTIDTFNSRISTFGLLLFCLFFVNRLSLGQTFTAETSANPVGAGEPFQITFSLSGGGSSPSGFQPPSFKEFQLAGGPFQSSQISFVNGRQSSSQSYTYTLIGHNKGKFVIGSASITVNGKTLKTQPITIEVAATSNKGGSAQQGSGQTSVGQLSDKVFIRASADRTSGYLGEQIIVTYKLYTQLQIAQPQISKLPSYQGFWAEEIATPQMLQLQRETLNGKPYNAVVLKKVALFPSQTGALDVTPFKLKLKVVIEKKRKNQGFFDDFFNDPFFNQQEVVEYEAVSNTVKIQALPLPNDNKPANYTNAVGSYKMDVSVDKQRVKQHDPVTLKITLSGNGNISLLDAPKINLPAQIDKFDPKTNLDINRQGSISGKKTFEYLLVPRAEGKVEIPALQFSFFNPAKKAYETVSSQPYSIDVEHGEGQYANSTQSVSKEDVKLLNQDIRYLKTNEPSLRPIDEYLVRRPLTWALFALPLLALGGVIFAKRREQRLLGDLKSLRNRKAEKLAKSRLKKSAKALKLHQTEAFYQAISTALFGYLGDKFAIATADLTRENIFAALEAHQLSEQNREKLKAALEECEFIRFAPATDREQRMLPLYNNAIALIVDIEAELQGRKK